ALAVIAHTRGLPVEVADPVAAVAARPDGCLGGLALVHVAEHLAAADLADIVLLSADKVRPGGLVVCVGRDPRSAEGWAAAAADGAPEVLDVIRRRPERVLLMYHNMAPADAFEAHDPSFAALLRLGRAQVDELAARVEVAFAASVYSAAELTAAGYRDVRVAPL